MRKSILLSLFIAIVIFVAWAIPAHSDRIVMLDVGQGDAFLLESQGKTLLIDTGNQDTKLLEALAQAHVYSLDLVALTHPDDDHVGSLDALRKGIQLNGFIVADGLIRSQDSKSSQLISVLDTFHKEIFGLNVADSFKVGAFSLTVLWPTTYGEGENADSLCFWVEYDGNSDGTVDFTALFTGDAESEQIQQILERYRMGCVDILKIGHHGSRKALTSEQVQTLAPKIALISVGAQNRYGHPSSSILEMLETAGTAIFRTDEDGQIEIRLSAEQLVVQ